MNILQKGRAGCQAEVKGVSRDSEKEGSQVQQDPRRLECGCWGWKERKGGGEEGTLRSEVLSTLCQRQKRRLIASWTHRRPSTHKQGKPKRQRKPKWEKQGAPFIIHDSGSVVKSVYRVQLPKDY